jgi:hypothetical protein
VVAAHDADTDHPYAKQPVSAVFHGLYHDPKGLPLNPPDNRISLAWHPAAGE